MGWRVGGGGWEVEGRARDRPQMEADHNWRPDMRLQGCAGSLVADM